MGDLIDFPLTRQQHPALQKKESRSCDLCRHAAYSEHGVFCMEFKELIYDEKGTAQECTLYDTSHETEVQEIIPMKKKDKKPQWPQPRDESTEFDPVILDDTLVDICKTYLGSLHCSTWGRPFGLDDTGLVEAAEWLATQIVKIGRVTSERVLQDADASV